ncbi:MAG: threonine/serine exporter family protein [Clostridiales bacterium]|nr:threonine/serine exporter family protein [Clostridiales bacterium]
MINSVQKKVLILALFAGEIMMKSGAEIYRVEDTVVRICKACKIDFVECFATTTGIFLSLDSGYVDEDMHTFIKRIKGSEIDLARISAVNTFSRVFTTTDLSVDEGFLQLRRINTVPRYRPILRLLGALLVGAFFCPFFHGSVGDMFVAGGISAVTFLVSHGIMRTDFPDFIRIFISCAAAAGLVLAAGALGASASISPVIVAATTIFLPGVAITNAARDLLSGDMLAGVARLAEACLCAVAIAGGIGIGIQVWMLGGGTVAVERTASFETPWFLLFGFCSTLGFGLLFNAPKKHLVAVSLIGAAGMFIFVALTPVYGMIAATFFGTCAIAILAEICSRAGRDATTIFIIPGIIPFVPGALLYETMSNLLVGNYNEAVSIGMQALIMAGCIALALILVATVTRLVSPLVRRVEGGVRK